MHLGVFPQPPPFESKSHYQTEHVFLLPGGSFSMNLGFSSTFLWVYQWPLPKKNALYFSLKTWFVIFVCVFCPVLGAVFGRDPTGRVSHQVAEKQLQSPLPVRSLRETGGEEEKYGEGEKAGRIGGGGMTDAKRGNKKKTNGWLEDEEEEKETAKREGNFVTRTGGGKNEEAKEEVENKGIEKEMTGAERRRRRRGGGGWGGGGENSVQFASRRNHCDSCFPESLLCPAVFPITEACALALPSSGSEVSPNVVIDVVNLSNAWGYIAIPQKASIHKVVFSTFFTLAVCSQTSRQRGWIAPTKLDL